jgi:hypothetical protein
MDSHSNDSFEVFQAEPTPWSWPISIVEAFEEKATSNGEVVIIRTVAQVYVFWRDTNRQVSKGRASYRIVGGQPPDLKIVRRAAFVNAQLSFNEWTLARGGPSWPTISTALLRVERALLRDLHLDGYSRELELIKADTHCEELRQYLDELQDQVRCLLPESEKWVWGGIER